MDFGAVLSKAWKTVWKHKILWLFGILAGCSTTMSGGGGVGGSGSSTSSMAQSGNFNSPSFMSPSTQRAMEDFVQWVTNIPVWVWVVFVLGIIGLGIISAIAALFLGTLGTTGVIKGTSLADEASADDKPLSLGTIFKALKPYYWKVLLLNVGLQVAGLILGLLIALPVMLLAICTCGLGLFLLVPLGWFIEVWVKFTTIAIMDEDQPIFKAIGRAWQMMIKNLGNVLVMFLILGIGQLVVGLLIALPMLLVVPVPFLINLFASGSGGLTVGLIISSSLFLVFLPVVILLGGVVRAYVLSAWTLTYRRLTLANGLKQEVISKPNKAKQA